VDARVVPSHLIVGGMPVAEEFQVLALGNER